MEPKTTEDILELMEGYIISAALGTANESRFVERLVESLMINNRPIFIFLAVTAILLLSGCNEEIRIIWQRSIRLNQRYPAQMT